MKNLLFENRCGYIRKIAETKIFYKKFFAAISSAENPPVLKKSGC